MAKLNKARQKTELSIEQDNAIDLLLQGKADREVAEVVGVSRQTVTQWRNNHSAFVAELNFKRHGIWSNQEERLRELVKQAVNVLEEDLNNKTDPKLRRCIFCERLDCTART